MSGTRGGLGRIVAMGIGAGAGAAAAGRRARRRAGKYAVAQCGWYVGADADWADTTGGAKFRPDACCVPPAGADPFDGAHLKSFTRDGQGDRLRHPLRPLALDGAGRDRHHPGARHLVARPARRHRAADRRRQLERRLRRLRRAPRRPTSTPRDFVAGFSPPQPALEDRLLCARAESKWCSLDPGSWSALRALTITVEDDYAPGAGDRRRPHRRRLAPRRRRASASGAPTSAAGSASAKRTLDGARVGAHRVPLREGADRRRVAGDPDAALPDRRRRRRTRSTPPRFSDGPHSAQPLRHRLRRQRRLHAGPAPS